jgi:trehalose-phosphatase
LFLDYDGTLAGFAPTPDVIITDPELIDILTRLENHPHFQPAIISGRRLNHILSLVPIPGILLAGTYGIELRTPQGKRINRLDYSRIRPGLDLLKPRWEQIISGLEGFYLEDKGWSLAIHARFADDRAAEDILSAARDAALDCMDDSQFRIMGKGKFLEVSPVLANKGAAIEYILERYPLGDALPVYVGDDDKDEEAFAAVNQLGGISIVVSESERETQAALRLHDPASVREWLISLLAVV